MTAPATAIRERPAPRVTNPVEAMRWACETFVWAPELGQGYFPVREQPYDAAYFDKYVEYARTPLGRAITAERIALVRRHLLAGSICDVGIGCGDFVTAMSQQAPLWDVSGFDINPAGVEWLVSHRRYRNPWVDPFNALTFWDALEHIPEVATLLKNATGWVFCSLPIVPGDGPPRMDWKHLRKDEHCWYWTRAGLIRWMDAQGFECVEHNDAETLLGREDVESFAFRRVR